MGEQLRTGWTVVRPIPDSLKWAQIEKIESSQAFQRAAQLRRIFRFLAERTLAGLPPPTEKEVAGQVLGRRDQFDPRTDSLVRKEMSRLRTKLAEYYRAEGKADSLLVRSAGSYTIEFSWSPARRISEESAGAPCLLVLPPRAPATHGDLGELVYGEIMARLGGSPSISLVSSTSARWYASQVRDVREISSHCGAEFIVELTLDVRNEQLLLLLSLVDGISGFARKSVRFAQATSPESLAEQVAMWLYEEGELVTFDHGHSHE